MRLSTITIITTTIVLCTTLHSSERYVTAPARPIPVIDQVDLVVVGGNEGGIAAAWSAAQAGARVILLNDTTFLGGELATKDRFSELQHGPKPTTSFSKSLFRDPTPSRYPVTTAELLLQAGVTFLYNTRHGGVVIDPHNKTYGVVTANKAGLQAVIAKFIIDATPAGAVAVDAGAQRTPWNYTTMRVSRPRLSANRKTRELIELDAPMPSLTWPALSKAEHSLREEWHLFVTPPFAHAMHFILPAPLVGNHQLNTISSLPPPATLDLALLQPAHTERLYLISSAAPLNRSAAQELMHPVTLAEVGERLGRSIATQLNNTTLPPLDTLSLKTRTPDTSTIPGLAIRQLREAERPYRSSSRHHINQPPDAIPVWAEYDVVVVGSGTAGHSAAIAAARAGARTIMIEQAGFIGGSTALGIRGFWRGYHHGFNQEWRGKHGPRFHELLRQAGVDVWYHSLGMGAVMRGNQVAGVEVATWLGRGVILGQVIIDASGEGDICAAAGAEYFYLNDDDLCLEEASFIGQKRANLPVEESVKPVSRNDLYADSLPADPIDIAGFTMHHVLASRSGGTMHYPMVQIRETRRIRGDFVIDVPDVNAGRTYSDVIAVSASAFDPHGFYSSDYTFAGLMPMTKHVRDRDLIVYIPFRSILPYGLDNIMVVGRNFSTTHDVQALVRMNADMLNLGYAAGHAAALSLKQKTTPRQLNLKPLQQHLAEIGILPVDDLQRITQELPPPTTAELAHAATNPANRTNLLTLARGGTNSIPPLKHSFALTPTLPAAKALALLGDPTGVSLIAEWLNSQPVTAGPAYAWDGFLAVPELDSLIWTAAIPRDRQLTPALISKLEACRPDTSFNLQRAILISLGRLQDPAAAPALAAFLNRPGIQGHNDPGRHPATIESTHFAPAMIELFAAAALFKCGDSHGTGRLILTRYLDDWRGIFVRYAGYTLQHYDCK